MGKHGWVSSQFADAKKVPVEEIRKWMHESFTAIAPKKLVEAPKPKIKARGTATLVCDDKLRAARAVKAFGERGVRLETVPTVDKVKLAKAKAIVVDIGRNPIDGVKFAEEAAHATRRLGLTERRLEERDQRGIVELLHARLGVGQERIGALVHARRREAPAHPGDGAQRQRAGDRQDDPRRAAHDFSSRTS